MPDQTGKTFLITGGNSGIGLEAGRMLSGMGARVVLTARDLARGEAALADIRAAAPDALVEILRLDLADLESIECAAAELRDRHPRLDVLVNNAGVMATPYRTTADGFELQLGTNHLGHFAFTGRVLPSLLAAERARVVTISSGAHRMGVIAFDDLDSKRRYQKWRAYGQSKLANLLFTHELDRRAHAAGLPLIAAAAHPGYAATNLQLAGPRMQGSKFGEALNAVGNRVFAQDAVAGAWPTVYAATMPDVRGGDYYGPDGFAQLRGLPNRVGSSAAARDRDTARRLWEVSVERTGVTYEELVAPAA